MLSTARFFDASTPHSKQHEPPLRVAALCMARQDLKIEPAIKIERSSSRELMIFRSMGAGFLVALLGSVELWLASAYPSSLACGADGINKVSCRNASHV